MASEYAEIFLADNRFSNIDNSSYIFPVIVGPCFGQCQ